MNFETKSEMVNNQSLNQSKILMNKEYNQINEPSDAPSSRRSVIVGGVGGIYNKFSFSKNIYINDN